MLYLIIASLLWAFSFGLIKDQLSVLDANLVSWARLLVTLPVFLPFLRLRGMGLQSVLQLMGIGAIQYGVLYIAYIASFKYLSGYEIALCTIFTPIYVTLIDNVYTRRIDFVNLLMALVAVLGAAYIHYKPGVEWSGALTGFTLVQVANFVFAWGQIAYRSWRKGHPTIVDTQIYALLFLGAAILTTLSTTYTGGWSDLGSISTTQWGVIVFLGVFNSGVAFYLWNVGALRVGAGVLAVMNNLKIPLAVVVSILIFKEEADLVKVLIGGAIMLGAIMLGPWVKKRFF